MSKLKRCKAQLHQRASYDLGAKVPTKALAHLRVSGRRAQQTKLKSKLEQFRQLRKKMNRVKYLEKRLTIRGCDICWPGMSKLVFENVDGPDACRLPMIGEALPFELAVHIGPCSRACGEEVLDRHWTRPVQLYQRNGPASRPWLTTSKVIRSSRIQGPTWKSYSPVSRS